MSFATRRSYDRATRRHIRNHHIRAKHNTWATFVLAALVTGAAFLHANQREHPFIAPWDEAFHAIVSEHLALHPLQPTLYEVAALTRAYPASWGNTHIWLHLPPGGLWAAALSMRLFGDTPLALRLPGLLFIISGMLIAYVLGCWLYGPVAGLLGAAFTGYAPYVLLVSQGYVFGDVTDTPLLFLVPLAALALIRAYRTGRSRWLVLAGVVAGLAYLTKGVLGLPPLAMALALALTERATPPEPGWHRLGGRGLGTVLGAAALTAVPYTLYTSWAFPAAARRKNGSWLYAFFHSYEGWGRPPDYHLTAYLFAMYGSALALLVVGSMATVTIIAMRHRRRADIVVVAWIASLYIPLSISVTKAAPMTIAAVPAVGLAVGRSVSLGLATRRRLAHTATLGVLLGSAAAAVWLESGHGTPLEVAIAALYNQSLPSHMAPYSLPERLAPFATEAVASAVATLACLGAMRALRTWTPHWPDVGNRGGQAPLATLHAAAGNAPPSSRRATPAGRLSVRERIVPALALTATVLTLGAYWLRTDLQMVTRPPNQEFGASAVGAYVAGHTPANATIVLHSKALPMPNFQLVVMFWARRDVYAARTNDQPTICALERMAGRVSSPLYVLSDRPMGSAQAIVGSIHGWTLYKPTCS